MKLFRLFLTALFIALTAFTFTTTARAATGATFTVNSTADQTDKKPGDGICATRKNKCTLRAAIMEHNARGGKNKITLPAKEFKLSITGYAKDKAKKGDLDITKGKLTIGMI